jgi:hypothetical protein
VNNHKNALLTPHSRAPLVQRIKRDGLRVREAAAACGESPCTAYKWLGDSVTTRLLVLRIGHHSRAVIRMRRHPKCARESFAASERREHAEIKLIDNKRQHSPAISCRSALIHLCKRSDDSTGILVIEHAVDPMMVRAGEGRLIELAGVHDARLGEVLDD